MTALPLALVTGGARRLGRAFALSLAKKGHGVVVHYHHATEQAADAVAAIEDLGVPSYSIQADLTQENGINSLFHFIDELIADSQNALSRLAVLVNSAAVMERQDPRSLSLDDWNNTLDLNLRAPFFCSQKAASRMKTGGLIVNISDVGVRKVWSGFPAYSISKAGLESLTRILARSFAPQVRVNAIAPGLVLPSQDSTEAEWNRLVGRLPLKRSASPDEITSALEFLLENDYITGQTLTVDGGYSLI